MLGVAPILHFAPLTLHVALWTILQPGPAVHEKSALLPDHLVHVHGAPARKPSMQSTPAALDPQLSVATEPSSAGFGLMLIEVMLAACFTINDEE